MPDNTEVGGKIISFRKGRKKPKGADAFLQSLEQLRQGLKEQTNSLSADPFKGLANKAPQPGGWGLGMVRKRKIPKDGYAGELTTSDEFRAAQERRAQRDKPKE